MKKITIVLISLLVLLGSISVVYGSEDQLKFTDVKKSDYYYNSVVWALNNKVTDGTSNTTFSPDATCTRAQVVTFLWRSMGQPEPISTVNKFSDVSETDWFYKPVLWAVEKGITDGTSLTTFSPSDKCRNSHILVFIYRAIGQPYYYDSDNWYNAALTWARNVRLINGTFEGEYDINAYSTRASVVEYLFRYEQVKQGTFKPPVFIDGNIVRFIKDAAIYNGPGFEYEHVISESGELGISPGHQLIVKAGNLGYIRDYVMKENGVWYNVGPSLSSENHQKIKRDWWVFDDGSVIIDRTMHEAVILALDLDGGVDFDADTPF
ncbi:MAG: S-layer homology domain-containing protein, partial [Firmicutes bacterium]|nr:S-layer homology domain-containing protein [Bacillota bacterium]